MNPEPAGSFSELMCRQKPTLVRLPDSYMRGVVLRDSEGLGTAPVAAAPKRREAGFGKVGLLDLGMT